MYTKENIEKIKETRISLKNQLDDLETECIRVVKYLKEIMPVFKTERCWYEWDCDFENFNMDVSCEGEFEDSYCDYDKEGQIYALKHESGAYGWYRKTLISIPAELLYKTDEELKEYVSNFEEIKRQKAKEDREKKEQEEKEKRRREYEKLKKEFG